MRIRDLERKDAPELPAEVKGVLDTLTATVETGLGKVTKRMDELEKKLNRPGAGGGNESKGDLAAECKALGHFVRTGDITELKSLSSDSEPDGGFMVSPALSNAMITRIFDQSPIRSLSRVETIGIGDAYEEPIDDNDVGATWAGQSQDRTATTAAQLGFLRVPLHEIYALQPVTQRLIDDARFDVGAWVQGKIADKFGRTEGTAFVNGTGIEQPVGFLTRPVDTAGDLTRARGTLQYVKSGSASVIADSAGQANGIVDLYWSMRAPYRGNATWLMASATANALDKLKTTQGEYIWRDGMTSGAPPSLLGRPVEFCEDMPAIAANSFPVAFGNWPLGYLIVDRPGIKWLQDPYTSKPLVNFYATRRSGGNVANSDCIKLLKISA